MSGEVGTLQHTVLIRSGHEKGPKGESPGSAWNRGRVDLAQLWSSPIAALLLFEGTSTAFIGRFLHGY